MLLAEESLCLLLHRAECRRGHCRLGLRSPSGGLAATDVGGAVAKRVLLADRGELAVKAAAMPDGRLRGGHGVVKRPRGGEVWVVADSVWHHVARGERRATTGIVPVIPLLLSSRVLRLRYDGPRARGTAEVVEVAAPRLLDRGRQFLLDGEAVAARR